MIKTMKSIDAELEMIRRKLGSYTLEWAENIIDDDLYHDLSIELIRQRDKLLVLKSRLDVSQNLPSSTNNNVNTASNSQNGER